MSNAVSVFDIGPDGEISLNHGINSAKPGADQLGNPVGVALSPRNDLLFVAGFEAHQITLLERGTTGRFSARQVVNTGAEGPYQCLNPHKLVGGGQEGAGSLALSSDGRYLYAAGEAGQGLFVLEANSEGQLAPAGRYPAQPTADNQLTGISSICLTADNKHLLVTAASSNSLLVIAVGR